MAVVSVGEHSVRVVSSLWRPDASVQPTLQPPPRDAATSTSLSNSQECTMRRRLVEPQNLPGR